MLQLALSLALVGGYDTRNASTFTFGISLFGGEDRFA